MKFFWVYSITSINKYITLFCVSILLLSCATHHPQYGSDVKAVNNDSIQHKTNPDHRFYLIGDAGYTNSHSEKLLDVVSEKLQTEIKNTTLLYLGDNIYPLGMPPKNSKEREKAEKSLDAQIKTAKNFSGKTYFIPGNHDWYNGLKGLERESKYITKKLNDKKAFSPRKGCAIDDIEINDNITLVTIDSQWFLEDWDDYPTINDDCDIKTRETLFVEFEDILNDNQDKLVLVAIHHPLMTNGSHGGQFSVKKQLYPINKIPMPILGSFINLARKASGYSPQDRHNKVYTKLAERIKTLIQGKDNVIVASGHDHNLQYINHDNIHQIVSGSGSKTQAARAINPNDFSYGGTGYAILDLFENGKAHISYFGLKGNEETKLFETTIDLKPKVELIDYPVQSNKTLDASIYTPKMTDKGAIYKFFFGKHYRKYYSTPITVNSVVIDTLYGGLKPVKAGGGHQSKSLRLADKNGKEFVMRGLKKSATRFLQSVAFKTKYLGDDLENTFAESFLLDFYTTAHPYTPFIIGDLAESANIYHTNPKLFYVPKHNALKQYNAKYGDELYMIEEHPGKEHYDLASFGKPDDIEGTDNMLEDLRKNKKYSVDERAYIRARLFDMLIGDWDRHADQWRWAKFEKENGAVYKPIPRDHDQAFSKYDGAFISILMNIPPLRHMTNYKETISNVKWMNREPYPLDLALTSKSEQKVWLEEAAFLQDKITDDVIDNAFKSLPIEIQDDTMEEIKANLKNRRSELHEYAMEYHDVLLKTVILKGTDKKEKFVITRLPKGETEVKTYSLKKGGKSLLHSQVYNRKKTKEIWIYGLDDDDVFEVKGKPEKPITIRLMGGQNNDVYTIENGAKIKIYDFKSKKNTFNTDSKTKLVLTDNYETNSYDMHKPYYNITAGYPSGGYNPDDGVKLGALVSYTINNFNRSPYSRKHQLRADYFFATNGFELSYRSEFRNVASKWNFALDARHTSPTYSINYFGYGNETVNNDDDLGMDYNRVKLQTFKIEPSIFKESRNGDVIEFKSTFETIEIENSNNRLVNIPGVLSPSLFEHRQYGGANAKYSFKNYDVPALPTMGMEFSLSVGWTTSFDQIERNFVNAEAFIDFVHKITPDNRLVFASRAKTKILFNNNFEIYQAATLGGDNNLRGYRRERFTGKQSAYHSSDLRFTLNHWKNSFLPITYGIFGGYDYGRVWIDDEASSKWHQSVGGGLWLNALDATTLKVFYFQGSDGGRIAFGLQAGL
ncbi:MAG: metallophosphoesterase [Flavobacterium sp. MedPE-SWcel]|uniref:metallophosphoesterase n=1 Tax=uncultured Flavobacterium sp. TaxID=165435 RepID=UPI000913A629|nr:metallophosphoesterase [uncultured Flavobacterium sp.]OIQ21078.1 MAG: metallophosphoesterase [Flavobacterium sp. MedPE-SWcel]